MQTNYLRDQRGIAMVFELVLVVAVLALVGLAVYQGSHRTPAASLQNPPAAPSSAQGLAASAAATVEQESAADTNISAGAEASVSELSATDDDVTNLGDSFNENNF
jgi:Tfp pilus assembly protein PilX